MRFSWKLGRIAGIDVFLHPTLLLLLAFVGISPGGLGELLLVAGAFGCVLLHELGHALTARAYGIRTADITLYPIGGVARLERLPRKPGPELLIALAGPAVNLVLAGGLWLMLGAAGVILPASWAETSTGLALASALLVVNLVLAGFNLIPAFPMDGGRVLRAFLTGWCGRRRATEIAAGLGQVLAAGFGTWCLLNGHWLAAILALFLFFAAAVERAQVQDEEASRYDPPDSGFGPGSRHYGGRWVRTGEGVWRLTPLVIPVDGGPPRRPPGSWR